MPIQHWMTFATFSEQEFFTYPNPATYDGTILNANMVAHAPAGIAGFLIGKVNPQAQFIIDPMTHAFQHNPETVSNEGGPKSSIKKLASHYGDFVLEALGNRPLVAKDVLENIDQFVKNVISFQWDFLASYFTENSDSKYLDNEEVVRRPSTLVAPYFYLTEDNLDDWLPVMTRAATLSVEVRNERDLGVKVYSALVINRSILQVKSFSQRVHEAVSGRGLDGVLVWVDEFDEASASSLELSGLASLCGDLRESELEVLNIHGGYFSCLLGSEDFGARMTGVSHGPEFGESRGVVPVGGGIPISRFYVPDLHLRAKFRDFLPVALRKGWLASASSFHESICACSECKAVLDGDVENFSLYGESDVKSIKRKHGVVRIEFPTTAAKKRCLRHYLNRKKFEFDSVLNLSGAKLIADLKRAHQKFYGAGSEQTISHLEKWRRAIDMLSHPPGV